MKNDLELDDEFADEFDFVDEDEKSNTALKITSKRPFALPKKNMVFFAAIALGSIILLLLLINLLTPKPKVQAPEIIAKTEPQTAPKQPIAEETTFEQLSEDLFKPQPPVQKTLQETIEEFSESAPTATKELAKPSLPAAKELAQPNIGIPKEQQLPPIVTANEQQLGEIKDSILSITQELTSYTNQLKSLQDNMQEISRTVNKIGGNVVDNDARLANLTTNIDVITNELKSVKQYMQEEDLELAHTVKLSQLGTTPEYIVHAIIPGRAWLKSSAGQIITITEGDPIGDYGKIAIIDSVNNLVRTSSGVIFR